jgi:hypothetical protein
MMGHEFAVPERHGPIVTARRPQIRRWIQVVLAAYLAGVTVVAAVHQHREIGHSHDCALCATAHMPKAMPSEPAAVAPPSTPTRLLLIPGPAQLDFVGAGVCRSRAPPQV